MTSLSPRRAPKKACPALTLCVTCASTDRAAAAWRAGLLPPGLWLPSTRLSASVSSSYSGSPFLRPHTLRVTPAGGLGGCAVPGHEDQVGVGSKNLAVLGTGAALALQARSLWGVGSAGGGAAAQHRQPSAEGRVFGSRWSPAWENKWMPGGGAFWSPPLTVHPAPAPRAQARAGSGPERAKARPRPGLVLQARVPVPRPLVQAGPARWPRGHRGLDGCRRRRHCPSMLSGELASSHQTPWPLLRPDSPECLQTFQALGADQPPRHTGLRPEVRSFRGQGPRHVVPRTWPGGQAHGGHRHRGLSFAGRREVQTSSPLSGDTASAGLTPLSLGRPCLVARRPGGGWAGLPAGTS